MGSLRFDFSGLYSDAPELPGDLDVLYRLVAEQFNVLVDGRKLLSEPDFGVVEFADAVRSWLATGFERGKPLAFEPFGFEGVALRFAPTGEGWSVGSDFAPADMPAVSVSAQELRACLEDFDGHLVHDAKPLGIELDEVLDRLQNYADESKAP